METNHTEESYIALPAHPLGGAEKLGVKKFKGENQINSCQITTFSAPSGLALAK
jgi:hypothetical protein